MRPVQSGTQNSILLAVLSNYFHSFRSPAFFISEIITFSHLFQSITVSTKVIHQFVYMPTLVRFEMLSCLIAECLICNTAAYLLCLVCMYLFVITGSQFSSNPPPQLAYIWVRCSYPGHILVFCIGFAWCRNTLPFPFSGFCTGQGRTDGAICGYTETDKQEFVKRLHSEGVRNIEMECIGFAAFTHHVNLRGK